MDGLLKGSAGPIAPRAAASMFLQQVARVLYPRMLLVHGCLLVGQHSRASLVIGGTGAGKSTLAAVARGLGIAALADDVVGLDSRGNVHPLPVPSGLRRVTKDFLAELGLPEEPGPIDYTSSTSTGWRADTAYLLDDEPVSAAATLFAHSFNAWCPSPQEYLLELAARFGAIAIRRATRLDLSTADGCQRAHNTIAAILEPLSTRLA